MIQLESGSKKFYVYVKDGDKVKKVSFGDTTNLSIKRDDPASEDEQDIIVITQYLKQDDNCDNKGK